MAVFYALLLPQALNCCWHPEIQIVLIGVALSKWQMYFLYLWTSPTCSLSLTLDHPEKKNKGLFHQITKTHGTIICVSTGVVLLLLIISILVQVKQPRKKVNQLTTNNYLVFSHKLLVGILLIYQVYSFLLSRCWYVRITCSSGATSRRCLTLHIMNSLLSEIRLDGLFHYFNISQYCYFLKIQIKQK